MWDEEPPRSCKTSIPAGTWSLAREAKRGELTFKAFIKHDAKKENVREWISIDENEWNDLADEGYDGLWRREGQDDHDTGVDSMAKSNLLESDWDFAKLERSSKMTGNHMIVMNVTATLPADETVPGSVTVDTDAYPCHELSTKNPAVKWAIKAMKPAPPGELPDDKIAAALRDWGYIHRDPSQSLELHREVLYTDDDDVEIKLTDHENISYSLADVEKVLKGKEIPSKLLDKIQSDANRVRWPDTSRRVDDPRFPPYFYPI